MAIYAAAFFFAVIVAVIIWKVIIPDIRRRAKLTAAQKAEENKRERYENAIW